MARTEISNCEIVKYNSPVLWVFTIFSAWCWRLKMYYTNLEELVIVKIFINFCKQNLY